MAKINLLTYLGKAFRKQTKTIEDEEEKQIKAIKNRVQKQLLQTNQKSIFSLFSKDFLTEEAIHELNKIVEIKQKIRRDKLIYKTSVKKKIKHIIFKSLKQ